MKQEHVKPFEMERGKLIAVPPQMTLRDWFAGMAMQGYLASFTGENAPPTAEWAAKIAYEYADAMLEARSKDQ